MYLKRALGSMVVVLVLSWLSVPGQGAGTGRAEVADAAMHNDAAAVRTLLAQKADVNAPQGDGATALHWAVYHGDKEIAGLLIRNGANVKAANRDGADRKSVV